MDILLEHLCIMNLPRIKNASEEMGALIPQNISM